MKRLILSLLIALCALTARAQDISPYVLLTGATATTPICSATNRVNATSWKALRTFSASGTTSAGAGAATIIVYGSNEGNNVWVTLGTLTLVLATTVTADTNTAAFVSYAPWKYVCAVVTAISGTGASVGAVGGVQ